MNAAVDAAVHSGAAPAALERAALLHRFASSQGSMLAEFEVTLTQAEAFELMQWVPTSGLISAEGLPQLEADIAEARRRDDPWFVLQHFTFSGLKTAPLRALS